MASTDKLAILASLSSKPTKTNLDRQTSINLASDLSKNTSITQVIGLASIIPVEIINQAKSSDIISNLGKLDVENMDSSRIKLIASKIASNASSSQIQTILSTADPKLIQALPYKILALSNVPLNSVSPATLPTSTLLNLAKASLNSNTLDTITNTNALIQVAKSLNPTDISKITPNSEIKAAINVINASNSVDSASYLTKVQRSALLNSIILYLKKVSGSQSPKVYFNSLSSSDASSLAELFIEAKYILMLFYFFKFTSRKI